LKTTQQLFSYGSLQEKEVQLSIIERQLKGVSDTLQGYKKYDKKLIGKYPIIKKSSTLNDSVKGTLYQVSNLELYKIDIYESLAYSRIAVVLNSGVKAWVYIPNFD